MILITFINKEMSSLPNDVVFVQSYYKTRTSASAPIPNYDNLTPQPTSHTSHTSHT